MNISGVATTANFHASTVSPGRGVGTPSSTSTPGSSPASQKLPPDAQRQVEELKARDRQVRQHEQAHMAAGAGLVTSSASFTYQKGPDGVSYAVGGEVGIDTSPGRTPDETILRAQQIRAAAMAPADPSGQDRAVAAKAGQMEQQAQMEKSLQPEAEKNVSGGPILSALGKAYAASNELGSAGLNVYA